MFFCPHSLFASNRFIHVSMKTNAKPPAEFIYQTLYKNWMPCSVQLFPLGFRWRKLKGEILALLK